MNKLENKTENQTPNGLQNPLERLVVLPFNLFFYKKIGRDKHEPEKAVLPAIIFVSSHSYPEFNGYVKGCMIAVGWWDWSIKIALYKKAT